MNIARRMVGGLVTAGALLLASHAPNLILEKVRHALNPELRALWGWTLVPANPGNFAEAVQTFRRGTGQIGIKWNPRTTEPILTTQYLLVEGRRPRLLWDIAVKGFHDPAETALTLDSISLGYQERHADPDEPPRFVAIQPESASTAPRPLMLLCWKDGHLACAISSQPHTHGTRRPGT